MIHNKLYSKPVESVQRVIYVGPALAFVPNCATSEFKNRKKQFSTQMWPAIGSKVASDILSRLQVTFIFNFLPIVTKKGVKNFESRKFRAMQINFFKVFLQRNESHKAA